MHRAGKGKFLQNCHGLINGKQNLKRKKNVTAMLADIIHGNQALMKASLH